MPPRPASFMADKSSGVNMITAVTSMWKAMLKKKPGINQKGSSMSLIGDYEWDKVGLRETLRATFSYLFDQMLKKFESHLNKKNFEPDVTAGRPQSL